jgi:hypothetical protein
MILGVTVGAFANYGFYGFAPLYFNRAFGLNYTITGRIAAPTGSEDAAPRHTHWFPRWVRC